MKCKRKKAMTGLEIAGLVGAIVSAIGTGVSTGVSLKKQSNEAANAKLQQRYENMSESEKNSQLFAGNLQSFYNNQDAVDSRKNNLVLPTLNNSQFKCGGKRYYNKYAKSKFGCKKK